LKATAAVLFQQILEYTEVIPSQTTVATARKLLHYPQERPELVGEFYFQLIKQTNNCQDSSACIRAWKLFLILATIFPASEEHFPWILAHIARNTMDRDPRISLAATMVFIRFQSRYYIGKPLLYESYASLERIPAQMTEGKTCFGCLLYEIMFCQKDDFPKLPIPYVLYLMITSMRQRNALKTSDIFRQTGNEGITQSILTSVNENVQSVTNGDVNVIANLVKIWLGSLSNPLVPFELTEDLEVAAREAKYLGFLERLPQVHRITTLYVIGFLKEIVANSDQNGMQKGDVAAIFGPLFVHPARRWRGDIQRIPQVTEVSVRYVGKLIESADPSIIYPLNPAYLPLQAPVPVVKGKVSEEKPYAASIASLSAEDLGLDG
jgi:hypothetical protein